MIVGKEESAGNEYFSHNSFKGPLPLAIDKHLKKTNTEQAL